LPEPQATSSAQTGAPVYVWTVPADGATDKLEVRAYGEDRRRVNVTLTYDVIARWAQRTGFARRPSRPPLARYRAISLDPRRRSSPIPS
jgi:hypothetical protein